VLIPGGLLPAINKRQSGRGVCSVGQPLQRATRIRELPVAQYCIQKEVLDTATQGKFIRSPLD